MRREADIRIYLLKSFMAMLYLSAISSASLAATSTFTPTSTATFTATSTHTAVVSSVWRVNAGGPIYPDSWGNTWIADAYYDSGTAHCVTETVSNTNDSTIYQCERYGNLFTYVFNVPPGNYRVTMKFAELYWTAAGERLFDVLINGSRVLDDYDIFSDAGSAFRAVRKVFDNISPAVGQIALQFGPAGIDNAQVCAIQINPMPPTPTPTGTPCGTPAIIPYLRVNGGAWQQVDAITVNQGFTVTLGPQPLTGGTWNWTGPSGFNSALREISGIPLTAGVNTFTAEYTDACGGKAVHSYNITMLMATPTATVPAVTAGCAAGISVDGVMDEPAWAPVAQNQVAKLCQGTNPYNISGAFKTSWDTDSLYVGVAVNDSYLNATQVACANYNDSAVEIYLDMANDRGGSPYPGSVGDFHFMISYDCRQFCLNAAVALPPTGMQYASTYDASGYTMEVKIPWTLLGVVPLINDSYGFDVQVDFNNGTNERVGQLVWNGDENDWQSSANFGEITLGYCPSPTATATQVPPTLSESFHVFPNPVNPALSQARFNYNISNESEVSITLYTISGNLVRKVLDRAVKQPGQHNEDSWDAKNESGIEVLSGVYLCVLEAKERATGAVTRLVNKMAVLR
ncbi:MAG: hypothetical protein LLG37_00025 [Spirochaetia bacterium]|nr:hypothetical protein [Spirochaetia bacterium]